MTNPMELLITEDVAGGFDPWMLRCWRISRQMTQAQFCKAMGFPGFQQPHLAAVEGYKYKLSPERIARAAAVLKVEPSDLMTDDVDQWRAHKALWAAWMAEGGKSLRGWLRAKAGVK